MRTASKRVLENIEDALEATGRAFQEGWVPISHTTAFRSNAHTHLTVNKALVTNVESCGGTFTYYYYM